MALVETYERSSAPIVVQGRTCTAVATIRRFRLAVGPVVVFRVRARPRYVEVIEPDGRRHEIHVPDRQHQIVTALQAVAALAAVAAWWATRRTR